MVKVLENRIIDLDLLPGPKQEQLAAQVQTEVDKAGNQIQTITDEQLKTFTKDLPEAQQAQVQAAFSDLSSIVTGAGGTAGGAVKGILDTAGNTVGALGVGVGNTLWNTGSGLVGIPGKTVQGFKGEEEAADNPTIDSDLVGRKAQDVASSAQDTVGDVGSSAQDTAKDVGGSTKKAAGDVASSSGGDVTTASKGGESGVESVKSAKGGLEDTTKDVTGSLGGLAGTK